MTEEAPVPSRLALVFKKRREELNMTQEDVARRVTERLAPPKKLTQQTYAAFEKGKSQSSKHSTIIADVLALPIAVVLETNLPNGFRPIAHASKSNASLIAPHLLVWDEKPPLYDEVEVPLFKEMELPGDSGHSKIQECGSVRLRIGQSTLSELDITADSIICAQVSGTSMEPVIPHGSTVGIDTSRKTVKDGDIFALNHNNQLRVRMLYRLPFGGLRIRSFNRDEYPDEEYSAERIRSEEISVIGRVFWYSVLR